MERYVEPEWLDELPASAPAAIGSRRDLRRLNTLMGNARMIARALRSVWPNGGRFRLVELGAGDGDLLLKVAGRLGSSWKGTEASLVDAQSVVSAETRAGFSRMGWNVSVLQSDVFGWGDNASADQQEVVVTNLFLHHFRTRELERLLQAIKRRSIFLVAMEPRRCLLSLMFSRLVGVIGCNAVTRHDARASVCAGFAGEELSTLWGGSDTEWQLSEGRAGLFGHLFVARKTVC
jgi:hypothetical protein